MEDGFSSSSPFSSWFSSPTFWSTKRLLHRLHALVTCWLASRDTSTCTVTTVQCTCLLGVVVQMPCGSCGVPKGPTEPIISSVRRTNPVMFFSSRSCCSSAGGPCFLIFLFIRQPEANIQPRRVRS
jgi:hypothetical protein